jgi:putative transposase
VIVAFIDAHRDEFGVEPICRVLQVAPSTYYSAKSRALSARAVRDAVMVQVLMVLWVANRKVYGAHKLWKAARRAGLIALSEIPQVCSSNVPTCWVWST